MAAPTVFEDVVEGLELEGVGQLFAGKKFWVAQRVPTRHRLLDDIKANGGEIVLLEKKADYMIADHFLRDCPPGSISYEFITKSIQEGRLRDPEDHRAGPPLGEAREPGAINRPVRGGRSDYNSEEDRILYKWVRDCEAVGGKASGNEIYKQLEAKYPRHTWQSWRDRYLKQLRNRPPSAFNIPDNAPPSPPSDHPAEQTKPATAASKQSIQSAPRQEQCQAEDKAHAQPDYTLDQLAATFTSDDWEELYAFVDDIDTIKVKKERDDAWNAWAKFKGNQTVEQWRQYYDKVVRPQWLRDPEAKRIQIKKKIDKKHEDAANASQSGSQQQDDLHNGDGEVTEVAPSVNESTKLTDDAEAKANKLSLEVKLMSSSTAQHESPKYIAEVYQNALKRVREDDVTKEQEEQARSSKRQKSISPVAADKVQRGASVGTYKQPVEILSSGSSSPKSLEAADDELVTSQIMQDMERTLHRNNVMIDDDIGEADREVESVESDDLLEFGKSSPRPEELEEPSEDDYPSNTPTPRATRQRPNNFDTQAILSSPSQGIGITRLPRPVGYTQETQTQAEDRSSSLAPHPESDASTTQSLQEFRRSLNEEDATQPSYPTLNLLPRARSLSLTPSITSSTDSGDPDVPLDASEIDDFFAEQNAQGFSDDFIAKALKRTRCRPGLAEIVLEAWRNGQALPNRRGIWSVEDDDAAESGDGVALAKLERKHTLDGWGGLTERMRFLDGYRSRQ